MLCTVCYWQIFKLLIKRRKLVVVPFSFHQMKQSPMKKTPSCEDFPKFFKVYIPDICFETLKIPNAFISRIKGALPTKVLLRCSSGKHSIVGVKQMAGDVFFSKYWQNFVQKNSVKAGDFLVFQYNGECIFDFIILDESGNMKEEEEEENNDEEMEEMDISQEEGPWEREEKEEEEMNDYESDDEDEDDVSVEDDDDDEDVYVEDDDDDDEDEDDEEDDDEDDEEQANPLTKKRSLERNGDTNRFHPDLKIGSAFIKEEEETDEFELKRSIHIKNPHFLTKPRSWMKERLNVPVKWLARQNLALEGTITFLGPLGKESPGTVVCWADGRIWIEGWGDFCGENNLKEDEKCICEFTPERGRWGKILRVHLTKNL